MREYNRAKEGSDIAWQHEEIPEFVKKAVQRLSGKGKALDLGCGTGVHAVYMARQGLQVTALDFIPAALGFAEEKAKQAGVAINLVHADVTEWNSADKYDLILDSGCLHNLSGSSRTKYKERVPSWLTDEASLVLVHFGKRSFFDFNRVGLQIKRKTKDEIERFFQPELELREFYAEPGKRPLFYYRFTKRLPT